ncbi:hypothetical protein PCH_Pc20g11050 [Penicillium rubens Wisconsin 54-1255]|uniref:Uncharacterized protein n=1 Tax=Penicillium rubens (strain ATCC 28089 / DSM 1075 / NRRL 1951 / Wisconsin 54-1255) TaxID=500485 RepID=B6HFZ7_PENRW|nr:hypothetical protein PCH_Pc20g11050 [Penicillium rubens Wisconsin 54-1255]
MSLCYVPLPNLTELEIQLPMTNDFAPLFAENISTLRIPIEQTLSRLQYLGLHVYAQTNQQSCAAHLLRIVELSTNLTSLSLSSTNYLSIDRLELGSQVCLRFLSLHKLRISSRSLVNIIEQCSESMHYIELKHLKIESGSWTEILSAMDDLPYLYDFDISVGETPIGSERLHSAPTLFFTAENIQDRGPPLLLWHFKIKRVEGREILSSARGKLYLSMTLIHLLAESPQKQFLHRKLKPGDWGYSIACGTNSIWLPAANCTIPVCQARVDIQWQ